MNLSKGYILYMVVFSILTIPVFIVPIFFFKGEIFSTSQELYAPLCHQLTSRSYCYFPDKPSLEDCYTSPEYKPSKERTVIKEGEKGYKLPVCSRDVGLYLFGLLGGIYLYSTKWRNETIPPPGIWLILALIPIGIDGTGQLFDLWESTNTIRLITGAIAGAAIPFYMVPLLNRLFGLKK